MILRLTSNDDNQRDISVNLCRDAGSARSTTTHSLRYFPGWVFQQRRLHPSKFVVSTVIIFSSLCLSPPPLPRTDSCYVTVAYTSYYHHYYMFHLVILAGASTWNCTRLYRAASRDATASALVLRISAYKPISSDQTQPKTSVVSGVVWIWTYCSGRFSKSENFPKKNFSNNYND